MKNVLIISIFFLFSELVIAQSLETCGAMYLIEKALKKNTKADSIMKADEKIIDNWIKANKPFHNYENTKYPLIEGFIPTSNPKDDKVNFALAKKALYEKNPNKYLKMTRVVDGISKKSEEEKRNKK